MTKFVVCHSKETFRRFLATAPSVPTGVRGFSEFPIRAERDGVDGVALATEFDVVGDASVKAEAGLEAEREAAYHGIRVRAGAVVSEGRAAAVAEGGIEVLAAAEEFVRLEQAAFLQSEAAAECLEICGAPAEAAAEAVHLDSADMEIERAGRASWV